MNRQFDVGVVGAGILGLAHAYHLARRGLRVVVFERHRRAMGASVRNFGMIWPIGQPSGERLALARRSRDLWLEVAREARLWHDPCGSLHLAYRSDEASVLEEFAAGAGAERSCRVLSPAEIIARFPLVRMDGLRCGLWSPDELSVDPREAVAGIAGWLAEMHGVEFLFDTPVFGCDLPHVTTAAGEFRVEHLVVCTGADFRGIAPEAFAASGLVACKLQMMRSQPFAPSVRLGTMLADGLTLRHYASFADCPSLPALSQRLDYELPEYGRYGIHVMAAQNGLGELVIGDSHLYGEEVDPFDSPRVDELILAYLSSMLRLPGLTVAGRWHGVYVKHPSEPYVVAHPAPGLLAVTGVGGAGMTLSFGLAEQTVNAWLGPTS